MPPSEETRLDGRQNNARAKTTNILILANHGRALSFIVGRSTSVAIVKLAHQFPSSSCRTNGEQPLHRDGDFSLMWINSGLPTIPEEPGIAALTWVITTE
jgi:hypothetical protein